MKQKTSKLMTQLNKEKKQQKKLEIGEDKIQDIYAILTKIDSKNLLISHWLAFMIQKGFVKNSLKISTFLDIYDNIKNTQSNQNSVLETKNQDHDKFNKNKFVMALKNVGTKICPYLSDSYEKVVYPKIIANDNQDVRLKVDEIRKFLTREVVEVLRKYERQLQIIYEIYVPENFNGKMAFTWQQLKYLEKKLPTICFFKFLWDAQVCPHHISSTNFIELVSKMVPPISSLNNPNHKQGFFYSNDTILTYTKEAITLKQIKLLEGDIGLTFLDFSMVLTRLASEITKQKSNFAGALQKFFQLINLKQLIANGGSTKGKPSYFQQHVKQYFTRSKKTKKNNLQLQKRETKKNIEQILEISQQTEKQNKNQFIQSEIKPQDFYNIKKSLDDDQLPLIPQPEKLQKQNDKNYKVQDKQIVIGEQIPKIPQKNKSAPQKQNDKKQQPSHRFPMQQIVQPDISSDHYNQILKNEQKNRKNTQYPVILTNIVYPQDIQNLYINPKAQIYVETTYIHLGQKNYQKAFLNFCKAKSICQNARNLISQFFFTILQAQIYEAAGRDGMAIYNYHKAKQIASNPNNKNLFFKCLAYYGIAGCLFHMEEYQYAFRCYLKCQEYRSQEIVMQSSQRAILQNNIGCCLMILNRNTEACKHFQVSHNIFDIVEGTLSARTLIAQQNYNRNKKAYIEMKPSFKTVWRVYEEKEPFKKEKVDTKAKKK